jgi:hypothetical protein
LEECLQPKVAWQGPEDPDLPSCKSSLREGQEPRIRVDALDIDAHLHVPGDGDQREVMGS